mmetsp:Transcript_32654/g.73285  ORF Transcript_32654/g.73285 Transcript_32654/m.73285 type:complete len:253 (-) Transcript_32654:334-1092(-)
MAEGHDPCLGNNLLRVHHQDVVVHTPSKFQRLFGRVTGLPVALWQLVPGLVIFLELRLPEQGLRLGPSHEGLLAEAGRLVEDMLRALGTSCRLRELTLRHVQARQVVERLAFTYEELLAREDVARLHGDLLGLLEAAHLREAGAVVDPGKALTLLVIQALVDPDGSLGLLQGLISPLHAEQGHDHGADGRGHLDLALELLEEVASLPSMVQRVIVLRPLEVEVRHFSRERRLVFPQCPLLHARLLREPDGVP